MNTTEYIETLKAELKKAKNQNRKDTLRKAIRAAKAELKGNYITIEDLKEYRNLVIFMARKAAFLKQNEVIKETMESLLNKVNAKELTFVTKRGIKGVIVNETKNEALRISEAKLEKEYGQLQAGTDLYNRFYSFRINVLS